MSKCGGGASRRQRRSCAWCEKEFGLISEETDVSHGICRYHRLEMMREINSPQYSPWLYYALYALRPLERRRLRRKGKGRNKAVA